VLIAHSEKATETENSVGDLTASLIDHLLPVGAVNVGPLNFIVADEASGFPCLPWVSSLLPANYAGRRRPALARRRPLVIVGSTAPARPPNQAAMAPSTKAIAANRAPRDTAFAEMSAAWVAFCLA